MAPLETLLRSGSAEKACELLEQNASTYASLWDCLQERRPSYERFVFLGYSFLDTNRRIRRIWKKLISTRGRILTKFVMHYAAYAAEILQNPKRSESIREFLEHPELLAHEDLLSQHIGNGNCVVGISASLKTLGKIKSFNGAFSELTGYTREELRDAKMDWLIPQMYREAHARVYEKQCSHMESGYYADEMPQQAFVLHKSKYIVPVITTVVSVPNYTSSYCFLVRLRRVQSATNHNTMHILADSRNVIVGITPSIIVIRYSNFNRRIHVLRDGGGNSQERRTEHGETAAETG